MNFKVEMALWIPHGGNTHSPLHNHWTEGHFFQILDNELKLKYIKFPEREKLGVGGREKRIKRIRNQYNLEVFKHT